MSENGLLDLPDVRLLVFTRHPASFVLSAVKYHLQSNENWARTTPQPELGGIPLKQALLDAPNDAHRQIIVMRQFRHIYERQASLAPLFEDERVMRLMSEELFTTRSDAFFQGVADFLRAGHSRQFIKALKRASPAYMDNLPGHSTGAFRVADPYEELQGDAKAFYDREYKEYETVLGYS